MIAFLNEPKLIDDFANLYCWRLIDGSGTRLRLD